MQGFSRKTQIKAGLRREFAASARSDKPNVPADAGKRGWGLTHITAGGQSQLD